MIMQNLCYNAKQLCTAVSSPADDGFCVPSPYQPTSDVTVAIGGPSSDDDLQYAPSWAGHCNT